MQSLISQAAHLRADMNRRKRASAHARLFGAADFIYPIRCSIIVAHSGDEVIGAGALISRLRDVKIVHVKNGPTEKGSAQTSATADRTSARRERCSAALALANIGPKSIIEFGLKNICKPQQLADLAKRIATFFQQFDPDTVVTHPYEGGHPDHDATAFATHAAVRLLKRKGLEPPALFEMALHPSRDGKRRVLDFLPGSWREATTLVLTEEARSLKRRMFDCFASAEDTLRGTPLGLEKFRTPPRYDFSVAPNSGKVAYEDFYSGLTGEQWQELARQALAELFPRRLSKTQRPSDQFLNGPRADR